MFSGIGGLDLGLEWGIKDAETVWQIEMEPFGRSILAKHWPDADRSVTDVRKGNAENLAPVDLISGGFPCQDISVAGNQKGFDGERSSLWYEMSRIIGELRPRPRFIVLENVAAITSGSMSKVLGRVLSDVASMGYNGEWHRVSAAQVGAPHLRNRWFFIGWLPNVGDTKHNGRTTTEIRGSIEAAIRQKPQGEIGTFNATRTGSISETPGDVANADDSTDEPLRGERQNVPRESDRGRDDRSGSGSNVKRKKPFRETRIDPCDDVANTNGAQRERPETRAEFVEPKRSRATRSREQIGGSNHWLLEPPVGRVVNGLSKRLSKRNRHALRALGNAVVPQCAELVGRRVQEIREILDNE